MIARSVDIAGMRFGRLVALSRSLGYGPSRTALWLFKCDCGNELVLPGSRVRRDDARSCGCIAKEMLSARSKTHGHSARRASDDGGAVRSRTYTSWLGMRERTASPRHRSYARYGGRGITVCDRWSTFENFLADMGEAPPGMSIDRIDNDGNYEPSNCRWATPAQQNQNQARNVLTVDSVNEIRGRGEHGEKPASIARRLGLRRQTVERVLDGSSWKELAP